MFKLSTLNAMLPAILVSDLARDPAVNTGVANVSYYDDLADLDIGDVGDLTIGDLEAMGALPRGGRGRGGRGRGGRGMMGRGQGGNRINPRMLIPTTPGVPMPGVRLQPLGFGGSAFTATSGTIIALQARPQRPFKGQRLVIDLTRTGTTATGLVTLTRLDIGTANQLVSSGSLTAAAFAPTAFDVNLQLDPAVPGIDITLQFAVSVAPSSSDRIDFGATLFGTSIG